MEEGNPSHPWRGPVFVFDNWRLGCRQPGGRRQDCWPRFEPAAELCGFHLLVLHGHADVLPLFTDWKVSGCSFSGPNADARAGIQGRCPGYHRAHAEGRGPPTGSHRVSALRGAGHGGTVGRTWRLSAAAQLCGRRASPFIEGNFGVAGWRGQRTPLFCNGASCRRTSASASTLVTDITHAFYVG